MILPPTKRCGGSCMRRSIFVSDYRPRVHPSSMRKLSNSKTVFTRRQSAYLNFIWDAHLELKFERRYFGPCVRQITSRFVIWDAHLKSRSRGVFELRISQITQRNRCMNAMTSKSCFGGVELVWPSNHFCLYTARCMRAPCMFDWQGTQTYFSRWNAKSKIWLLVCTLRN